MKDMLTNEAVKQTGSIFLLINVAARRAEQLLQRGNTALQGKGLNPVEVALREIAERKLHMESGPTAWKVED